jgi:hypothetical protein
MQMVMKTAGLHGSRLEIRSSHPVPIRVGLGAHLKLLPKRREVG